MCREASNVPRRSERQRKRQQEIQQKEADQQKETDQQQETDQKRQQQRSILDFTRVGSKFGSDFSQCRYESDENGVDDASLNMVSIKQNSHESCDPGSIKHENTHMVSESHEPGSVKRENTHMVIGSHEPAKREDTHMVNGSHEPAKHENTHFMVNHEPTGSLKHENTFHVPSDSSTNHDITFDKPSDSSINHDVTIHIPPDASIKREDTFHNPSDSYVKHENSLSKPSNASINNETSHNSPATSPSNGDIVLCPVCSINISSIIMDDRIKHVEECLSLSFVKQEESVLLAQQPSHGTTSPETSASASIPPSTFASAPPPTSTTTASKPNSKKRKSEKSLSPKKEKQRYVNKQSNVKKPRLLRIKSAASSIDAPNTPHHKVEPEYNGISSVTVKHEDDIKHEKPPPVNIEIKTEVSEKITTVKREETNTGLASTVQPQSSANGTANPVKYRRGPIPELKVLTFPKSSSEMYLISVDAFSFRPHEIIDKYFLTHFHADHYGGISKKWCSDGLEMNANPKKIYCSTITGRLLRIRFNLDEDYIRNMDVDKRYMIQEYTIGASLDNYYETYQDKVPGLYVTLISANHCPGAVIFLFESVALHTLCKTFMLHCGDFRVNLAMINHEALRPFHETNDNSMQRLRLDKLYLDTTYMSRNYNFPKQEMVCDRASQMFYDLIHQESLFNTWFGTLQSRITDFLTRGSFSRKKKLLILVGTYLIGKERVAIAISKKLDCCPIFVSNIKSRGDKKEILSSYDDEFLNSVMTDDDLCTSQECNAVIHLVPMDIVSSPLELSCYFNHNKYFDHFERCVGLRPSGWTFSATDVDKFGPSSSMDEAASTLSPSHEAGKDVAAVSGDGFKDTASFEKEIRAIVNTLQTQPSYDYVDDILKQSPLPNKSVRPGRKGAPDNTLYKIYGLPYSEHSSYRELTYFVVFLNLAEVIPTVNTHNEYSVKRMNDIIDLWLTIKELKYSESSKTAISESLFNSIKSLSLDDF